MMLEVFSLTATPVLNFVMAIATWVSLSEPIRTQQGLSLLHGRTRAQLHAIDSVPDSLFLHDLALCIDPLWLLRLPKSLGLAPLKHRILPQLLLPRLLHPLQLLLFIKLLPLPRCNMWYRLLRLSHLRRRPVLLHRRITGRNIMARPTSLWSTRTSFPQILRIRHQFRRKRTFLSLPFKLVVFLRLVRLIDLSLPLVIQFGVSRLLILIKWLFHATRRHCSQFLFCDSVQIYRTHTSPHGILPRPLTRVLGDHFVFGQLSIWLECVLLFELLFLGLSCELLLFVFHEVTLVHEEVSGVH